MPGIPSCCAHLIKEKACQATTPNRSVTFARGLAFLEVHARPHGVWLIVAVIRDARACCSMALSTLVIVLITDRPYPCTLIVTALRHSCSERFHRACSVPIGRSSRSRSDQGSMYRRTLSWNAERRAS